MKVFYILIYFFNLASFLNPIYEDSIKFLKGLPFKLPDLLPVFQLQAQKIAEIICKYDSLFVLGKGFGEAISKEIALKIKEVSYIHAEGYNAGTFKHGPIAMIDSQKRTPVIVIVVKDNFYDDMVSNYNQIKARNATVILITNASSEEIETYGTDFIIQIPNDGIMSSFYAVFVGQLIAYYLSISKGFNPDKPRQLSKEITTK
jgi:glucosamine--fructose-6-phosphate aminotransferase (isomerizing)